jgi:hypothetical protein
MVPHPAAVPATTRGHRRCMGMACDHPRDLNLNKAPAAECSGRVVEQPERVGDHYPGARLWAARRAGVSSAQWALVQDDQRRLLSRLCQERGRFEQPRRHRRSLMREPSPSAGRTRPG